MTELEININDWSKMMLDSLQHGDYFLYNPTDRRGEDILYKLLDISLMPISVEENKCYVEIVKSGRVISLPKYTMVKKVKKVNIIVDH